MLHRFYVACFISGLSLAARVHAGAAVAPGDSAEVLRVVVVCDQGSAPTPQSYAYCEHRLRIELLRPPGPVHWNLVDLAADTVTVVFPHNQSFEVLPAPVPLSPASPAAVVPSRPRSPATAPVATGLDGDQLAALPADLRDRLLAAKTAPTTPPAVPDPLPDLPIAELLRTSFPPTPGAPPAPVAFAVHAGFGGAVGTQPTLEPQADAPRTLHGMTCLRYLLRGPGGTLEIWATTQGPFPFHLLVRERGGFGPADPRFHWAEVARNAGLFPIEVRTVGATPRTLFAVVSSRTERMALAESGKLFAVPAGYRAIQLPDFARTRSHGPVEPPPIAP